MPPEDNADRFYAGPGPDSLQRARLSWRRLAQDLKTAANDIDSAVTTLAGAWQGAAATEMARAAAPYLVWLRGTAERARLTARLAGDALNAYRSADNWMISPPTIATNIALREQLRQDNEFGQNAHAIARAELEYLRYWHTNAEVMENYQNEVAAAMQRVQPFTEFSTEIRLVPIGSTAHEVSGILAQG